MTVRTIPIRDIEMSYEEVGSGPPLVLLHGGLATAAMSWPDRYATLAKRFRVLAPDSRGHGRTSNPSGALDYGQMADDVAALCVAVGAKAPFVLGFSDGGQIALELGLRHPALAAALVLGGTVSERTDEYVSGLRAMGFAGPGELDFAQIERAFGPFLDAIKRDHRGNGEPEYWRDLLVAISALWHTVPSYSAERLASIETPALIITGDRDHLAGLEQATRLYRLLPNAELAVVPGADHSAVESDVFWSAVLDFLGRQG